MTSRIQIQGDKELSRLLKRLKVSEPKQLSRFLANAALDVENEAKLLISGGSRSGKVYRRGKTVQHQASRAGEAPKTDTGDLVRNITTQKDGASSYTVGSRKGAPHGFWLEFGTRKMAKRPWLMPSFKKALRELTARLK